MILSGDLSEIQIISARLMLRALTAADADESFGHASPAVASFMSWNRSESKTAHKTILQQHRLQMRLRKDLQLVIRLKATNEFIGCAGVHEAEGTMLETGIWIKEAAQGKGYSTEAIAAVTRWAGEKFSPSCFLYPVVDANMPSRKLAERLGGKISGTRQRQRPGDEMRTLLLYHLPVPECWK